MKFLCLNRNSISSLLWPLRIWNHLPIRI